MKVRVLQHLLLDICHRCAPILLGRVCRGITSDEDTQSIVGCISVRFGAEGIPVCTLQGRCTRGRFGRHQADRK